MSLHCVAHKLLLISCPAESRRQAHREDRVGGLATPGPATFGGLRRRPEIYKVRQNVPF